MGNQSPLRAGEIGFPDDACDVFLSFASEDLRYVLLLKEFLELVLDVSVYVSHEKVPRLGTEDWITQITAAIKKSRCFIPLMTPVSVTRPWVLYEAGLADAFGQQFCRVKSSNISIETVRRSQPGPDRFVSSLTTHRDVLDFSIRVLGCVRPHKRQDLDVLARRIKEQPVSAELIRAMRGRSSFFAGSLYVGTPQLSNTASVAGRPELDAEDVLRTVTRDLTRAALDAGFSLCCYPWVSAVGQSVPEAVSAWCAENGQDWRERLDVSSGAPVPEQAMAESGTVQAMLDEAYQAQRKEAIRGREWVLILGGNRKTRVERDLAEQLPGVNVLPIPIFDGVGYETWKSHPDRDSLPVGTEDHVWTASTSRRVIEYMLNGEHSRP